MSDKTFDTLVVGGGIIGLSIAYECARHGMCTVLLERSELGRESAAAAGIVPAGHDTSTRPAYERLLGLGSELYPELSQRLCKETTIDNGYQRCGGLELARNASEAEELRWESEQWTAQGINWRRLTTEQVGKLEPSVTTDLEAAYELPETARLDPSRHLQALAAACRHHGAHLVANAGDCELVVDGQRVVGAQARDGKTFHAETTVVAAGSWTRTALAGLDVDIHVRPVRGQIALLAPEQHVVRRIVMWGRKYLVPKEDGGVIVGSTEDEAGFQKHCTVEGISGLLAGAMVMAPSLARARFASHWAGLRPASADGLPWLGPVPGYTGILVAAGHYRLGLQMAPATARVVFELVSAAPPCLPIDDFRLDRPSTAPQP